MPGQTKKPRWLLYIDSCLVGGCAASGTNCWGAGYSDASQAT